MRSPHRFIVLASTQPTGTVKLIKILASLPLVSALLIRRASIGSWLHA